jgi:hypothetical protein
MIEQDHAARNMPSPKIPSKRGGGLRGCDLVCVSAYFAARKIAAIV